MSVGISHFILGDAVFAYIGPGAGITFLSTFFVLLTAFAFLIVSIFTWPIRFVWIWIRRQTRLTKPQTRRAVVLGLDGLDPARVRRLMSQGRLPHLKSLAEQGTFTELRTTLPPISPVAWSSFQTGVNPGKHNIFDFLNRDLRTYLPELSSTRITESHANGWLAWLGLGGASIRLLRKSQPFWKILGDYGVFSTIIRVPITFPPEKFFGLSLSAMCLPDLRGTQGSFTLFTTDQEECRHATGGLYIAVTRSGNRIETSLPGPPHQSGTASADFRVALQIQIFPEQQQIEIRVSGQVVRLGLQKASEWCRIRFPCGTLQTANGICQFRLEALQPHLRLYVSPIHLDPERPAMPMSHPLYYSIYLAKLHNSFATLGLAEDTWGLNSGAISEEAFLEQAWKIHDERERMFLDALRRMQRGLTVCVFDASDRIQHMFFRHDNPAHPANKGRDIERHAAVIDQMYERMDELVGRAAAELGNDDVFTVISDHGFCEFRRAVNLNVWLEQHGYLTLRTGITPGEYLADVDWTKTRAYAFGLSGIYINQTGRESRGIVSAQEAAALRDEIIGKLETLNDKEHACRAIRKVYDSRKAYHGAYVANGPDLIVGYERGYRASWDNAVGRCHGPVFQDNTRFWSGDHCVDPTLVPGVFFSNRRLADSESLSILDMAPTLLQLFGVPIPAYMDGRARSLLKPTAVPSQNIVKTQELSHDLVTKNS
ncbi:MAG: type phosphodiesterase/nucleotide pyrophosphatase, partial [Planctomycetaceae bacterium]|nr:type phosphodiesterase/nucleotide pyrophosphatase [Planctomycetaceae bacterium]